MMDGAETELDHYLAISRAVAGEMDLQNVLNGIAGAVKSKLLDYHHLDVAVVLPGDRSKHFALETGIETVWNRDGEGRPNELAPVRQVLSGEIGNLVTGDAWADPRFHFDGADDAPIFEANLRSRIHVPLTVHGDVIGVLSFSSPRRDAYGPDDVRKAQNVADLIAPYFYAVIMSDQAKSSARAEGAARGREHSLRHGAQRLTEAMETERLRLGMELHDQTLADLSTVYRRVSRLAAEPGADRTELQEIAKAVSRCTVELRRIIENAKPGVLDLFGVSQAIEAQLERATQGLDRDVATVVTDKTGGLLDKSEYRLQLAVFRIVQEAVTNAVKHSECSVIEVRLSTGEQCVTIAVTNDGRVPAEGWRRSGGGVDNIRTRAALIGAEVAFERDPSGSGSSTVLRIPCDIVHAGQPPGAVATASPVESAAASPASHRAERVQ
ncbi:GAF domain-containing protein [Oceanicola sp. D3]|uniref:GAF domain-containing sensor histidine kinase n=1 Tax=Oceanicola sp. D3 TaxID=2587163 RepID=UPI0011209222|nr:GAF domain-containing protein [Oceanicola sp. D3]QDC08622.1 GAF domain-containing protein [Oceanicola sp. D3]